MTQLRYSSTTLESIRFAHEPTAQERVSLLASGWERHPREGRLFLLKKEVRAIRLSSVEGFVLPVEADWHDKGVLHAIYAA